jgi:hypothetical protein
VAQKPANEKLWAMVIAQAKAKYSTYPNPAASHWVHERYVQSGGKFIDSSDPVVKKQKAAAKEYEARHKKTKETTSSKSDKKTDKKIIKKKGGIKRDK